MTEDSNLNTNTKYLIKSDVFMLLVCSATLLSLPPPQWSSTVVAGV